MVQNPVGTAAGYRSASGRGSTGHEHERETMTRRLDLSAIVLSDRHPVGDLLDDVVEAESFGARTSVVLRPPDVAPVRRPAVVRDRAFTRCGRCGDQLSPAGDPGRVTQLQASGDVREGADDARQLVGRSHRGRRWCRNDRSRRGRAGRCTAQLGRGGWPGSRNGWVFSTGCYASRSRPRMESGTPPLTPTSCLAACRPPEFRSLLPRPGQKALAWLPATARPG